MISESKLKEIMLFLTTNGETTTLVKYEISKETLNRYKRKYRYEHVSIPKVLLLDVETAPIKAYTWSLFKPYLSHDNIVEDWFIISWAAKWLFSGEMDGDVVTSKEAIAMDDSRIMKSAWKMLDDSDVVIGHNLRRFDIKRLNTRFLLNKQTPPSPYQTIDTLTEAKKNFAFASNRLDWLGELIRRKGKIDTDFELWKRCKAGEKKALDYMFKYNKEDVFLLEDVYVEIRPWVKSHPNLGVYMNSDKPVCSNCGSHELIWEDKYYATMAGKFAAYRCSNCGAYGRCGYSAFTKQQRKNLLRPIAR